MARFHQRPGHGHPSIAGQELRPHEDGTYHVTDPAGIAHMRSTGFEDADAPPKPAASEPAAATGTNPFRTAVARLLGIRGVKLTDDAPDAAVGNALAEHLGRLSDQLKEAAGANDSLCNAIAGTLGEHGVSVPAAAPAKVLVGALDDLKKTVADKIAAAAKAAEERVLAQFADEHAALKARAETAEARVAELEKPADKGAAKTK